MRKTVLMALVLFMSMPIAKSQVTIGSNLEPGKAALLDLKTKAADENNVTITTYQPGGLVLPRVQLVNINTLQPFIDPSTSEWKNGKLTENKKVHTGMMVYNLANNSIFTPGIYFWDGNAWVAAKGTASASVTASNGLTKTSDNIQLGGDLITNTTVDPKTYELDFKGGLKIKDGGRIFMEKVRTNAPASTERIATLGIDDLTGEVVTMKAYPYDPEATAKALNYVEFQLTGEGDWIQNFDTKIRTDAYTLVVVGYRFATHTALKGIVPGSTLTSDDATPIVNVFADKYDRQGSKVTEKSVWYIHADYAEAKPADDLDGTWTINCLVISNSLVKVYEKPISYGKKDDGFKGTSANGKNGLRDVEAKEAPAGLK